jgi:hypothetical protein
MPDDENADHPPETPADSPEAPLDRQAYLRGIRREMLKKLGLPENTKPEQVSRILAIKASLGALKKSGDNTA